MKNRTGFLTVYAVDSNEIYGEFTDASWEMEDTEGGMNHLFSGTASDGALDTLRRIDAEGIANVSYTFDSNGYRYAGTAQLLAPDGWAGQAMVRIESGEDPQRVPAG